jgi:hypothetical protein
MVRFAVMVGSVLPQSAIQPLIATMARNAAMGNVRLLQDVQENLVVETFRNAMDMADVSTMILNRRVLLMVTVYMEITAPLETSVRKETRTIYRNRGGHPCEYVS